MAMACLGLKATTQTFHSRSSSAIKRVNVRMAFFAHDVGRGAVVFGSAAAPKIDDVAGTALLHKGDNVLGTKKSAAQIGFDDAVPKILAHEAGARPARNAPVEMRHDAGVVDQCVDAAEPVENFIHHMPHVFFIAHVSGNGKCVPAATCDFGDRLVQALDIGVGQCQLGAGLG